ncbi:hypothetical protein WKW77_07010 [Variovorax ureilyticus]|uniref:Uncharacterized protein n=1 Tax=Variovorax ureilyticus TaxID=1836198 RepID=A0ABU8VCA9_9BURK
MRGDSNLLRGVNVFSMVARIVDLLKAARTAMKTLWIYVHAIVASIAWLFILLALCLALLDANAGLQQDPAFISIGILLTLGHLSGGTYLMRRVREEVRATRRIEAASGSVTGNELHAH